MQPEQVLREVVVEFRRLKELAEKALAQVTEVALFTSLDEESNSIALLVKHLSGSMRSRWTDFLTSDGEKPDRKRDSEFVRGAQDTRESLMQRWEAGWDTAFGALHSLTPEDLGKTVFMRGEPHSVIQAICRQLTHCAYHVGQIVLLAKHHAGSQWKPLSIPRGKSEEFTAAMRRQSGC